MRKQHSSSKTAARRPPSRRLFLTNVILATGMLWLIPAAAIAQTAVPGLQLPAGMLATSPLNPQSTRPVGIPLGSTEIATPGISPVNPVQGMMGCPTSSDSASSGALFDGGGLSGPSSTNCTGGNIAASPLPSTSTVGRVGIPLGSTEIGGAGISPTVPVPGPTSTVDMPPIAGSGNP